MYEHIEVPQLARPATRAWLAGGPQVFPTDPVGERARTARLLAQGRIIRTRRVAPLVVA